MRTIIGEHFVIGEGLAQRHNRAIVQLNDSAAYIWQEIQHKDFTVEDVAQLLHQKYEFDLADAQNYAHQLLDSWKSVPLLEE